jgi:hypothetical protein
MQVRLGAAVVAIAALSATPARTENALVREREMTRAGGAEMASRSTSSIPLG